MLKFSSAMHNATMLIYLYIFLIRKYRVWKNVNSECELKYSEWYDKSQKAFSKDIESYMILPSPGIDCYGVYQ